MCGRYSLATPDLHGLDDRFTFRGEGMDYEPRYNVAPTQKVHDHFPHSLSLRQFRPFSQEILAENLFFHYELEALAHRKTFLSQTRIKNSRLEQKIKTDKN